MKIGNREFDTDHETYIMAILNVTPDSFSDGGKYRQVNAALFRAEEMIKEGADLIDIGGESTRPGSSPISADEEMERVLPVIEAIHDRFDIQLSVDTYKSETAKAAIAAGADLINDIWGLKYDENMAPLLAESGIPCCLMHNRKTPEYRNPQNIMPEVLLDLKESLEIAKHAGIAQERIILDAGIGFAKNYEQNLEVLRNLTQLHSLGYPLLLGTSRKSEIGQALGGLPVEERLEGTLVTTAYAVFSGYAFVRVHDVKENVRAVRMARELRGPSANGR